MVRTIFRFILLTVFLALATATTVLAQTPRRASGLDSLNNGGDLGGNNPPPTTLAPVRNDGGSERSAAQRFTLSGRTLNAAPRGQIVILRRRTPDGYVMEKRVMR